MNEMETPSKKSSKVNFFPKNQKNFFSRIAHKKIRLNTKPFKNKHLDGSSRIKHQRDDTNRVDISKKIDDVLTQKTNTRYSNKPNNGAVTPPYLGQIKGDLFPQVQTKKFFDNIKLVKNNSRPSIQKNTQIFIDPKSNGKSTICFSSSTHVMNDTAKCTNEEKSTKKIEQYTQPSAASTEVYYNQRNTNTTPQIDSLTVYPENRNFIQDHTECITQFPEFENHGDEDENCSMSNKIINNRIGTRIIDNSEGFGWKGLGERRIIYDGTLNEYKYEVYEPHLSNSERNIKKKLTYLFRTRADLDVFNINEQEKTQYLYQALQTILKENHIKISDDIKDRIFYHIFRDFIGYGKIDILMHDDGVEDISCDGLDIPIFIYHRKYQSISSNIKFDNQDSLDSFVVKLSQMCGKQISVYEPVIDGKLTDGSRLQTTLARTITHHSTFTIRRFRDDPLTPIDLIANNTISLHMAAYFWMAIEHGCSILFCGGTATGKTTMLNGLSLFLPSNYKIVSIEDTREINLPHENWVAGTTRTGFSSSEVAKTGKDIDMFDLLRVALRQRPQAIIVGEVRGKEAYTLFQAMTTGHMSYSTVHASNIHALIQRLENPPIRLPRVLLTSLDLVVFLNTVTIGGIPHRRVTNAIEIIKLDPESNRLVTMTPFSWMSEIDDRFEYSGGSKILNKIRLQNGWNDEKLHQELDNRMVILEWMKNKNLRSYKNVGRIVSEYRKNPEYILKKVKEDSI